VMSECRDLQSAVGDGDCGAALFAKPAVVRSVVFLAGTTYFLTLAVRLQESGASSTALSFSGRPGGLIAC
jgi:hypothetical protein